MAMAHAGQNQGSYIQETTYKYVGLGRGEFEMAPIPGQSKCSPKLVKCCAVFWILALLAGLIALLWYLFEGSTTTTMHYSCNGGFTERVRWSRGHQEWCCSVQGKGCHSYDCNAGLALAQTGWTSDKKAWCCSKEQKGCPVADAEKPEVEELSYDCNAGLINWQKGWSAQKQWWCCKNHQKGCPETCKPMGCMATCYGDVDSKGGGDVTCRDRTEWARDYTFDGDVKKAIQEVKKECECQCSCTEEDMETEMTLGTCLILGDTHVVTFDHAESGYSGQGQSWLVKSDTVHVQAQFSHLPYAEKYVALQHIMFGGPFMDGHTLEVGPLAHGHIKWDGEEILEEFGPFTPEHSGTVKVIYDAKGQLVTDDMGEGLKLRVVHINLPNNVFAQVYRWSHHVNVRIRMPVAENQDGNCGNFNGEAHDDSLVAVSNRIGNQVKESDNMFEEYLSRKFSTPQSILSCPPEKLDQATQACKKLEDTLASQISNKDSEEVTKAIMHGCEFDVCFVGAEQGQKDLVEGW